MPVKIQIEGEELLDAIVEKNGRIKIPEKYAGKKVKVIITPQKPNQNMEIK